MVDFQSLEGQNDKCDDFAIFKHNFIQECATKPNVCLIVLWRKINHLKHKKICSNDNNEKEQHILQLRF